MAQTREIEIGRAHSLSTTAPPEQGLPQSLLYNTVVLFRHLLTAQTFPGRHRIDYLSRYHTCINPADYLGHIELSAENSVPTKHIESNSPAVAAAVLSATTIVTHAILSLLGHAELNPHGDGFIFRHPSPVHLHVSTVHLTDPWVYNIGFRNHRRTP